MNRERARELLPIIQAFADGKDIQFRQEDDNPEYDGSWLSLPKSEELIMTFPADDYEYRIKPKPREWEIVPSRLALATRRHDEGDIECIRVREVIPNEVIGD